MNIPDPRHAAATAPTATPPAPQWGGQEPSVIDPGLIAHLANAFFNPSPGQIVDPNALANFAAARERPPIPPTSPHGTAGAVAAAPATSIPSAQSIPFVTELPSAAAEPARAPTQHIPAAGLVSDTTGLPFGAAATPGEAAAAPSPSVEKGQQTPQGALTEADLHALPQSLGNSAALVSTGFPSGFPFAGFSPAGHFPSGSSEVPGEALYFAHEASAAAAAPALSSAAGTHPAIAQSLPAPSLHGLLTGASETARVPGDPSEQSPTFATNYPTETDLRPQGLNDASLGQKTVPAGFSHTPAAGDFPAIPGETLYFVNEPQAAAAPHAAPAAAASGATGGIPQAHFIPITPELQPLLAPDLISGSRAFNAHAIKRDFPILRQQVHGKPLIWLDNAATTQKPQAVIDRLSLYYETENSNVHRGAHALAARSTDAYEAAREKVRRFLGAGSANDIIFVRGATEAINLVAQAWGRRNIREGDEIVITWLEHHANIVPWQMLCAEKGAVLRVAPVDDRGQVLLEEYTKLLGPRTRLVSFSQVSNALGTVTPAQEMVAIAHRYGACVLVDGAQAVSHMPVDVQALDCDFYAFSGHKVFGPTGIGVLYGKPDVLAAMPPWQGGGNMIADVTFEKTIYQPPPLRFEAGTGIIGDAVGLGAAIDYLDRIGMANVASYEHALLGYATQGLLGVPGLNIIGTAHEKAGGGCPVAPAIIARSRSCAGSGSRRLCGPRSRSTIPTTTSTPLSRLCTASRRRNPIARGEVSARTSLRGGPNDDPGREPEAVARWGGRSLCSQYFATTGPLPRPKR